MIKTLIVDDIEQNAIMLRVLLENYNHRVSFASNGEEALKLLKKNSYDLIISDILMPKLNGFEFCELVKADSKTKDIPFIFYTATYMDNESKKYGLSIGADRYLLKPLEPQQLLNTIADVFEEFKTKLDNPSDNLIFYTSDIKDKDLHLLEQMEQGIFDLEKKNKILKHINSLTLELVMASSLQEYFDLLFKAVNKYFPHERILVTSLRDNQFVTIFNQNVPITLKIIMLKYIAESKKIMSFDTIIHTKRCNQNTKDLAPLTITGSCCFLPYTSLESKGVIAMLTESDYNFDYADYFFENLYPIVNSTIGRFKTSQT